MNNISQLNLISSKKILKKYHAILDIQSTSVKSSWYYELRRKNPTTKQQLSRYRKPFCVYSMFGFPHIHTSPQAEQLWIAFLVSQWFWSKGFEDPTFRGSGLTVSIEICRAQQL